MKKILVPTDFSECARNATHVALMLAVKMEALLYFLHIVPELAEVTHVPGGSASKMRPPEKISQARSELSNLIAEAEHLNVEATQVLVFDKGNARIEDYIKPYEIEMIIMGSHGVSGIRELFIGSNTERIIRHTTIPVLVVKRPMPEIDFSHIVFASTFVEDTVQAFGTLVKFCSYWSSQIHILFVNLSSQSVSTEKAYALLNELKSHYPLVSCTLSVAESNDEEWSIAEFAEKVKANLIALTRHDKAGFIFSHSVAEDLVNHSDKPILVLSEK